MKRSIGTIGAATSAMHQQIVGTIERVFAGPISETKARLAMLKPEGAIRRFMVARMGSTGSAWLAKLLNSHPEVHCTHEGIVAQIYPATSYSEEEIFRYLKWFAWDARHGAYEVVGDVGSVWASHLGSLPFTTALLVRHPARVLNTRLTVYPTDQAFTTIPPESRVCIRESWGIDIDKYDPIDQIFLHDAFIFAGQVRVIDAGVPMIRIEDMRDMRSCQATLKMLTGFAYEPALIKKVMARRVNQTTAAQQPISQIVAGFTPRQRDWYRVMLGDVISDFGYSLTDGP